MVKCEDLPLKGYDACLRIAFPQFTEYAGLMYVGSEHVMEGKLLDNDEHEIERSHVSATLHDGEFLVRVSKN